MDIRVPKILTKLQADEDTILILQSSTNDITNLRKLSARDKEAMAEKSARQMVDIAKKAIMDFHLMQVIILAKPRRVDDAKLEQISQMSNSQLERMIALEDPNTKLAFQENSEMYKLSKGALFGYKNFDGIHLNSGV